MHIKYVGEEKRGREQRVVGNKEEEEEEGGEEMRKWQISRETRE